MATVQAASGCSSSSGGSNGPGPEAGAQDSSTADSPGQDSPVEDAPSEAAPPQDARASDAAGPGDASPDAGDGAPPLAAGALLVAGASLTPYLVTSTGYVAYTNDATGIASAVALTGGAPQQIAAGTAGHVAIVPLFSNPFPNAPVNAASVAVLTDTLVADGGVPNLPFTTWSLASGAQTWWGPGVLSELAGSADGSRVAWLMLDGAGTTGSLYVSSSTFQQADTVATGLSAASDPPVAFGGVNGTDLIVGLPSGVLEAYDTSTGTAKPISSNLSAPVQLGTFQVDPTGMHVAFLDATGSLRVATAPGYSPVLVSSAANLQPFPVFSPDGATLYFYDSSGTIYRSPVPVPGAVTVATGATQGIDAVSPDGNWLLASTAYASNPFGEFDVQLVSSQATAGTLTPVDSQPRAFEQSFTTDATHVLEYASPSTVSGEPTGIPYAPQTTLFSYDIATKVTSSAISTSVVAAGNSATGSLVVFYDNPRPGGTSSTLLCDLRFVDVSAASPMSSLIQTDVVCGALLNRGHPASIPRTSSDGKTVVYGYQGTAYQPGIYAYTLP